MKKVFLIVGVLVVSLVFFSSSAFSSHTLYTTSASNSDYVTRAEFLVMLVRARDVDPALSRYSSCFTDVQRESFADEVCYAHAQNWIYTNGAYFRPYDRISFADARTVVERAFGHYTNQEMSSYLRRLDAQMLVDEALYGYRGTETTRIVSRPRYESRPRYQSRTDKVYPDAYEFARRNSYDGVYYERPYYRDSMYYADSRGARVPEGYPIPWH